ncbi:C2 calcium-dependent membrane targeting [Macleaya cordata]|uniref:Phospholipase D n=1 Tax=Macleaya cordata TaxID=56857 RepID=A0A200Q440_MACCD|nr:C2 calcium-dependent membrane targeting [Macleaya cordata]
MAGGSIDSQENAGKGSEVAEKFMFLHGDLELWIFEARSLPNMDLVSERMRRCFTMFSACTPPLRRKKSQSGGHNIITSDPYVSVCLAGATVARTRVIANNENPSWDEHFCVPVAHPVAKVEFQVKDNDVLGAQLIGVVDISVEKVISGTVVSGWFPIVGPYGNPLKPYPELRFSLQFKPVKDNRLYKDGVSAGPDYLGVPNTYFPLRKGGNLTLYQDAHVPDNMLPEIPLDGGKVFQQGKCWEDICHAILEAHHLIYIVGWSIYHRVKIVREPTKPLPSGGELTLGELLKFKSQEGVRVMMLIWDDKTSHDKLLLKTEGVMQTHDEETRKFFRHSTVHCVLSPRYASNKLSIFKQQVVGTLFTHHQKCVILDTQASGNNRKITAFIGGLDLCDGRYDTPEHRLFRDIDSVFADDFHNPTFSSRSQGPRQPWHDLHCKVEGPAAYDILTNFEQRWRKVTKWKDFRIKKVRHWHDDALIKLDRISWILTPTPDDDHNVRVHEEEDPENWHVQVFRSIDSGSVKGFPKDVKEAEAQNLVCEKNLKIDKSIHTAYVKAIRSAQHFIYIENQYFLGSSYYWPSYKNAGADNLVPMELALKIASKIIANEHFSVYVVIPMWPEGVPTSASVQEILFWQGQTMDMMYRIIAQALDKEGLSNERHPQDYLNFYCLGKREAGSEERSSQTSQQSEALASAQKFRRFMIYVHAKGMIVDDEYVIMGSANINQRSLDGSRDTEIAMGAYQPHHNWAGKKSHPRGQVYGYRMSLWAEHLGTLEDSFSEPQTIECVKRVNELAQNNWKSFVSTKNEEMKGHLMRYPVMVGRDGKVKPLPGYECFPDVGGKILGVPTTLPDTLTT